MELFTEKKFSYAGDNYVVQCWRIGDTFKIRAFHKDGRPANGYAYQIELETATDIKHFHPETNGVKEMIDLAQRHVEEDTWKKVLAAEEYFKNNPMPGTQTV
jgi:hypothetical protein